MLKVLCPLAAVACAGMFAINLTYGHIPGAILMLVCCGVNIYLTLVNWGAMKRIF